jgi:hypothetical protein
LLFLAAEDPLPVVEPALRLPPFAAADLACDFAFLPALPAGALAAADTDGSSSSVIIHWGPAVSVQAPAHAAAVWAVSKMHIHWAETQQKTEWPCSAPV